VAVGGRLLNSNTPAGIGGVSGEAVKRRGDVPIRATKSFSFAKCSTRANGASRFPIAGAEKWLAAEANV
jgi:hypothetical protein